MSGNTSSTDFTPSAWRIKFSDSRVSPDRTTEGPRESTSTPKRGPDGRVIHAVAGGP